MAIKTLIKYCMFLFSYMYMHFALDCLDLSNLSRNQKILLITIYLDLLFLMTMLILTHRTRQYFRSMGFALLGNALAMALVALSMQDNFRMSHPVNLMLFFIMCVLLFISFKTIYQDIREGPTDEVPPPMPDRRYHNPWNSID